MRRAAIQMRPRGKAILGAALVFAAAGVLSGGGLAGLTFVLTAAVLASVALWIWLLVWRMDRADRACVRAASSLSAHDPVPAVLTGRDLVLLHANPAACVTYGDNGETTLTALLDDAVANAPACLFEMAREARAKGSVVREFSCHGGRLVISAQRAGDTLCFWRIETRDAPAQGAAPELDVPVLCVNGAGAVISANAAARDAFGADIGATCDLAPEPPLRSGRLSEVGTRKGRVTCLVAQWPRGGDETALFFFSGGVAGPMDDGWAFFESLPVPLLKLARDGRILLSNRPAREALAIDSGEGRRLGEVLEGPGRPVRDWIEDAAAGRGTPDPETVPVRGARDRFVRVSLTPADDGGETVVVAVLQDATRLKSLEAQFAQSQKMQAIGQLAGGVAHDFNNLLTAISGHCDLLLLRHDRDDGDYADLIQISQNANRAAALVSQLLAYSRKQTMRPRMMDLRDMLSDITHLLNRLVGEKVSLTLSHDPALWPVRADRRQLEQVLMNLVVNARDAMRDGGEIRIETENRLLTEPLRRDRAEVPPGRYVTLNVSDEGTGIDPEDLDKVFEPFFTTKRPGEGTGLGLSTVYGIMKQTGGFIFVDSTPGEGTRFMLLLPAHETGAARAPASPPAATMQRPRGDGVVLLVEDEAPVRAFASRALKMRGFSVLEAETAEDALDLLSDPALQVDVFVTDVIMPGKDGPTWVREALESRPDTRVVFISGYAPETLTDAADLSQGTVFLPKPFSLTELTETVQRQLAS